MTTEHEARIVDTESRCLGDSFNHWFIRAGPSEQKSLLARCTKGISSRLDACRTADEVYFMALTFGTLLSSQGADAHRHDPFGPIGGNPTKHYSGRRARVKPGSAQLPTWSPHTGHARRRRVALGGCSTGSPVPRLRAGPSRLRSSNTGALASARDARVKSAARGCGTSPVFAGVSRRRVGSRPGRSVVSAGRTRRDRAPRSAARRGARPCACPRPAPGRRASARGRS